MLVTGARQRVALPASALRRGADDYLAKDPALAELLPQILERVRRGRELRKALAEAERDLVRAERLAAVGEMTRHPPPRDQQPADGGLRRRGAAAGRSGRPPRDQRQQGLEEIRHALRRIRDIVQRIGDLREVRSKDYCRAMRMVDLERGT